MPLSGGSRLGPYEIGAPLGAGGMGEVYRARDTKLNRDVAIKVLPDRFARNPERLARFQREAQVLASLNPPHIGAIYGLEESDGVRALVLELVDGPTLADRIAQGAIPLDEALPIARQMAETLEAAHEQGVIHRDLKPANIKLTREGLVKVLDFGLAKLVEATPSDARDEGTLDVTNSPTVGVLPGTMMGMLLGTAPYMSPEQARGLAADQRSDLWAFGCILFEMLSGRRAFEGGDASETLAFVLAREPDWTTLPPRLPTPVVKLLRACLVREHRRRLADASTIRFALEDVDASANTSIAAFREPTTAAPRSRRRERAWLLIAAGFAVVTAAISAAAWMPWKANPVSLNVRVDAALGADAVLETGIGSAISLSPRGDLLAFTAIPNGSATPALYLRHLDQLQAAPLPGTAGARNPFFSPDGRWIAFFADQKLKKVAAAGGLPLTLADAGNDRGGTWIGNDVIAFAPRTNTGLMQVPAGGGPVQPLTTLDARDATHRWPDGLPGGRAIVYTSNTQAGGGWDQADIVVRPLSSGAPRVVRHGGYYARYAASGHLLYIQNRTLFAIPFDANRLETTGDAVPILDGVTASAGSGGAQIAISPAGTAAVVRGGEGIDTTSPIAWLTSDGKTASLRATPSLWNSAAFSADGHRLAFDVTVDGNTDVWIYDWERDAATRLTFDRADDQAPIWSPDGRWIVFGSNRTGRWALYAQRADGTGDAHRLTPLAPGRVSPTSWHPGGKFIAFDQLGDQTNQDIMILPVEGLPDDNRGGSPAVFAGAPYNEQDAVFSPDGRWLAHASNESGRLEVFVRSFPGPGGKWQVSSDGGFWPLWSPTRKDLHFLRPDRGIMVASYDVAGDTFMSGRARPWTTTRLGPRSRNNRLALHPDGLRFAIAPAPEEGSARSVLLFFNFFEELRHGVPRKKLLGSAG